MLSILLAASAAALVPASADGALVLDGASGAAGIRALLGTAGRRTLSLSPEAVGRALRERIGVDLLAEQPQWGLARRGARAMVAMQKSLGLSAPVANPRAARAALEAWLGPSRLNPSRGAGAAAGRAGMVAKVAGSQRLLLASGPSAQAVISALSHPVALTKDKALLQHASGPAWLYLRGRAPLRAALFAIDASAAGITARGLLVPLRDPILQGSAPALCEGTPPGCLRAGLGPSGRELLALVLSPLHVEVPAGHGVVQVRLEGVEAEKLADEGSLPRAVRVSVAAKEPQPGAPAAEGQLDLSQLDAALSRLTPLDALRGSLAAGTYAAHLIYGPLLRNAGPLTLQGAAGKAGAEIELRLPVR